MVLNNETAVDLGSARDDTGYVPESSVDRDNENTKRQIGMSILFLVLMILYVTFCYYYRKVKIRRSIGDNYEPTSGNQSVQQHQRRRQQQRMDNQAVLDESSNATERARQNTDAQQKLEERKKWIRDVLLVKRIVEEERDLKRQQHNSQRTQQNLTTTDKAITGDFATQFGDSQPIQVNRDIPNKAPMPTIPNQSSRATDSVQEEVQDTKGHEDSHEPSVCPKASQHMPATTNGDSKQDQTIQRCDTADESISIGTEVSTISAKTDGSAEPVAVLATALADVNSSDSVKIVVPHSLPSSSCTSTAQAVANALFYKCQQSSGETLSVLTSINPSNCTKTSLSSPTSPCHDMTSNSCSCSSTALIGICGNHCHNPNSCCCSCNANANSSDGECGDTILLGSIIQLYGEECNICLSPFQVGDRAAWSRNIHFPTETNQNINDISNQLKSLEEGALHGCKHAFHEECISRWLLVRDGCPICRRSYCADSEKSAESNLMSSNFVGVSRDFRLVTSTPSPRSVDTVRTALAGSVAATIIEE